MPVELASQRRRSVQGRCPPPQRGVSPEEATCSSRSPTFSRPTRTTMLSTMATSFVLPRVVRPVQRQYRACPRSNRLLRPRPVWLAWVFQLQVQTRTPPVNPRGATFRPTSRAAPKSAESRPSVLRETSSHRRCVERPHSPCSCRGKYSLVLFLNGALVRGGGTMVCILVPVRGQGGGQGGL